MIKTIKVYKDVVPAEDYSWALAMTDSERLACASRLTQDLWSASHGGNVPTMDRTIVRLVKQSHF